ncbi:Crp/Fnr family transcriptional regulator [Youhaiella tibetensis]|uniref:Crp/Fnr family transcriptional regulator n=1 Tax=Paradevosia tibetensis TaxID=1447062 RepID=A0A5B9DMF5_9HYPH|nr:Crp/Fnr family transcriptional regulator [Youhaiella tibetensis]QEE20172.1 Crp/Fnr family transcriptional regulator [Youhaiella tibetensis]GGF26497.1 Crp/Fnr family transcriptional regulator [Youhaiella tibetensis]
MEQPTESALQTSLLFPVLNDTERQRFVQSARRQHFKAQQPIFRMGDPGVSMMLIEAGLVRISYPSAEGRVIQLAELGPGTVFGEIALLDGGDRSADASAATDCALLVFPRQEVMTMLAQNWQLTSTVLRLLCERLRRSDERMADLAFFDLPGRLAKTLLERAARGPNGRYRVSDTQGVLAEMVGGSRETVNRCLHKWEREGLVELVEGRIYLLDRQALGNLAR